MCGEPLPGLITVKSTKTRVSSHFCCLSLNCLVIGGQVQLGPGDFLSDPVHWSVYTFLLLSEIRVFRLCWRIRCQVHWLIPLKEFNFCDSLNDLALGTREWVPNKNSCAALSCVRLSLLVPHCCILPRIEYGANLGLSQFLRTSSHPVMTHGQRSRRQKYYSCFNFLKKGRWPN